MAKSSVALKSQLEKLSWKNVALLILAGAVNTVGAALILLPTGILDGGLSGTSMFLSRVTMLPLSVFLIILNVPFYIFAAKKLGTSFVVYSLVAIFSYSLFSFLFNDIMQISGSDVSSSFITNNIVLAAIFGGLISGVGSGLTIRGGGALDGIEVVAVMLTKKLGVSVGKIVMTYNVLLFVIAGFFVGFDLPLFSIVAYAVGIKAVDGIVEGLDRAKAVMIISAKGQAVAQAISENMGRGITVLKGEGFFSKAQKSVIYYVVNRFEIGKLKKIISIVDASAFVSITDVSEVVGTNVGFGSHLGKRKSSQNAPKATQPAKAVVKEENQDTLKGETK